MKPTNATFVGGCAALALAILILGTVTAEKLPDADTGGKLLTADMTGAAEIPGPGDTDGSGFALVTLNPGQETVCFDITVQEIETATAAHIHPGGPTEANPPIVDFEVPVNGLSGCVSADRELIKDIMKNPGAYYVNVHNDDFPGGAVRGQLE